MRDPSEYLSLMGESNYILNDKGVVESNNYSDHF